MGIAPFNTSGKVHWLYGFPAHKVKAKLQV